jgi:hypothetical protein
VSMPKKVKLARRGVARDDRSDAWRNGEGFLGIAPRLLFDESAFRPGASIRHQKGFAQIVLGAGAGRGSRGSGGGRCAGSGSRICQWPDPLLSLDARTHRGRLTTEKSRGPRLPRGRSKKAPGCLRADSPDLGGILLVEEVSSVSSAAAGASKVGSPFDRGWNLRSALLGQRGRGQSPRSALEAAKRGGPTRPSDSGRRIGPRPMGLA